jgi:hypothetical protein
MYIRKAYFKKKYIKAEKDWYAARAIIPEK